MIDEEVWPQIEAAVYRSQFALLRQPDDKLIAVGHSPGLHNNRAVFTLARYTDQGGLDRTFGHHS
jgi:hypothetical protein